MQNIFAQNMNTEFKSSIAALARNTEFCESIARQLSQAFCIELESKRSRDAVTFEVYTRSQHSGHRSPSRLTLEATAEGVKVSGIRYRPESLMTQKERDKYNEQWRAAYSVAASQCDPLDRATGRVRSSGLDALHAKYLKKFSKPLAADSMDWIRDGACGDRVAATVILKDGSKDLDAKIKTIINYLHYEHVPTQLSIGA